ncbi:hypothetical protein RBS60_03945 [Sinomonas sp. ASV486]|uniref:hypothetical protein n=1 Tax=Sinomonas sp. ASV486 TaxID=3051170 RepID=UPI0027DB140E|nr:hypothetical protein [Sinomonas sp. ASV486]MDQ4489349.1 hypothetical protein [Sinomonas sp. ASV486]
MPSAATPTIGDPDASLARATGHKIEDALRQRLNARMDSVRALVRSCQELDDAKAMLKAAEDEDVRRWNALTAGWTPEELRTAGLTEPEKKARVRKRATRRSTAPTSAGVNQGT